MWELVAACDLAARTMRSGWRIMLRDCSATAPGVRQYGRHGDGAARRAGRRRNDRRGSHHVVACQAFDLDYTCSVKSHWDLDARLQPDPGRPAADGQGALVAENYRRDPWPASPGR